MLVIDKLTPLTYIGDVKEPRYSTDDVLIACFKIDRAKHDIKLVFSNVNKTSEYAGEWFIGRKKAKSYRKKMSNNGMDCYVIPFSAFCRFKLSEHSIYEL